MRLMIDISKEMYNDIKSGKDGYSNYVHTAVRNGTPLPKGHGRLIDGDRLDVITLQGKSDEFVNGVMWVLKQIDNAPTILEASESEG